MKTQEVIAGRPSKAKQAESWGVKMMVMKYLTVEKTPTHSSTLCAYIITRTAVCILYRCNINTRDNYLSVVWFNTAGRESEWNKGRYVSLKQHILRNPN